MYTSFIDGIATIMSSGDDDHTADTSSWWSQSYSTASWLTVAVGVLTALTAVYVNQKEAHYLHLDKPYLATYREQFAGKTIIITGANTGVGYYAARQLAGYQTKLVLACRDKLKAEQAAKEITAATGNKDVSVQVVDISDFRSIESLAKRVDKCHILINNAGAVFAEAGTDKRHNVDRSFLTNYLGPWYLTRLLLPTLLRTSSEDDCEVRVLTVGSRSEKMAPLGQRFAATGETAVHDMFRGPDKFQSMGAYGASKLANMMFAYELSRKLETVDMKQWWRSPLVTMAGRLQVIAPALGSKPPRIAVNLVTPGMTNTDLVRNYNSIILWLSVPLRYVALKPAAEGASELVFAASKAGVTGKYFGEHQEVSSSDTARSPVIGDALWRITEEFFAKIK